VQNDHHDLKLRQLSASFWSHSSFGRAWLACLALFALVAVFAAAFLLDFLKSELSFQAKACKTSFSPLQLIALASVLVVVRHAFHRRRRRGQ